MLLGVLGPLGDLGLALVLGHRGELVRVEVRHAVPAGQVLAVEQGGEALRRLRIFGTSDPDQDETDEEGESAAHNAILEGESRRVGR